jgi:hypothetical protein
VRARQVGKTLHADGRPPYGQAQEYRSGGRGARRAGLAAIDVQSFQGITTSSSDWDWFLRLDSNQQPSNVSYRLSLWLTLWEFRTVLPERHASVEPESALAQNR